jgi:hypothetical protein
MRPVPRSRAQRKLVGWFSASGLTTVVVRAVDTSGNRSEPSNEIVVQCP